MISLAPGLAVSPSLTSRLILIATAFIWMIVIGRDFRQRIEVDQNVAAAEAEDGDTSTDATLERQLIEGPGVVALIFRQGYAWAEAHGVSAAAQCPSDDRAFRDGCRARVAGVR